MLWRDALIMYDRGSNSLWTQITGEAVAGPMEGARLPEIPSELTTWGDWKRRHPETKVLVKPPLRGSQYANYHQTAEKIGVLGTENPDPRLGGKVLVAGLEIDGKFSAVPIEELNAKGIVSTIVLGKPVILVAFGDGLTVHVYQRNINGMSLNFRVVDRRGKKVLRDANTGSVWNWETGEAFEGKLSGKKLQRVETMAIYWAIWARFHPDTALFHAK